MEVLMSRKAFGRLALMILVLIGSISFVSLRSFPIFVDEAVHLWWVHRIIEFGEWWRPLGVGKPLEAWLVLPMVKLGCDALTCMRALHVIAGIVTVLLVYLFVSQFAHHYNAFVSALLTAISPWIVFYQRLALADIYLCAAGLFVLYAIYQVVRKPNYLAVFLFSVSLVLAALSKMPVGFLFSFALPLALIFMSSEDRSRLLRARRRLLLAFVPTLCLISLVAIVAALRIWRGEEPGFGVQLLFRQSQSTERLSLLVSNLIQLVDEFSSPLTPAIALLLLIGMFLSLKQGNWVQRWLASWSLLSLGSIIIISSWWSSRYFLFVVPPMTISAISGWQGMLNHLSNRIKTIVMLGLLVPCVIYLTYQSGLRIFNPPSARWSHMDWRGYIADWPSGYGYPEMALYLLSAPKKPSVIYTFEVGTAMQLRAYLTKEAEGMVQQLRLVDGKYITVEEARAYLIKQSSAWLVTNSAADPNDPWVSRHLLRIVGFRKPFSTVEVTLYEVIP